MMNLIIRDDLILPNGITTSVVMALEMKNLSSIQKTGWKMQEWKKET